MGDYYPDAPIRRFWFMRGRLEFDAEFLPPPGTERGDTALFEEHIGSVVDAGEIEITEDEAGVKGFIYGSDPIVKTATIRWSKGPLLAARESLLEWSTAEGWQLAFDSTWEHGA